MTALRGPSGARVSCTVFATTASIALALASGASCVPASEPLPPAGAIGFVTEPSPATRGEPFVTDDGWTITVRDLVLQVNVSGSSSAGRGHSFDSGRFRFRAGQSAELFARGLSPGPATAKFNIDSGTYISAYDDDDYDDDTENVNVPAEVVARFRRPADVAQRTESDSFWSSSLGPSLLIALHAEREGRVIDMDLTVLVTVVIAAGSSPSAWPGEVRANELSAGKLHVSVESLFTDLATGSTIFDEIADADTNGDGTVDASELNAASACASIFPHEVRERSPNGDCVNPLVDGGAPTRPMLWLNVVGLRANAMLTIVP